MELLGAPAEAFVIAVQEVAKEDWHDQVSVPEVNGNPNVIIKNQPREEWPKGCKKQGNCPVFFFSQMRAISSGSSKRESMAWS